MDTLLGLLTLAAIVAYIPLARFLVHRFYAYMANRRWLRRHGVFYASLTACLYTPGCLALDLRHGNMFPIPVPAWVALVDGSIWGGFLPLCVGWFIAYGRVAARVTPQWQVEAEREAGRTSPRDT